LTVTYDASDFLVNEVRAQRHDVIDRQTRPKRAPTPGAPVTLRREQARSKTPGDPAARRTPADAFRLRITLARSTTWIPRSNRTRTGRSTNEPRATHHV
jgi:hypothetical protein